MKMKTELTHRFNRNQVLPIIGEVKVDENGFIDVKDEQKAIDLEKLAIGFYIVNDKKTEKVTKQKVEDDIILNSTKENDGVNEGVNDGVNEGIEIKKVEEDNLSKKEKLDIGSPTEYDIMKATLESKEIDELKAMAESANFKKVEWVRRNTKESMIEYLLNKLIS